eukprot:scaffold13802_cov116-Isochrysis_galbana.AAC.1
MMYWESSYVRGEQRRRSSRKSLTLTRRWGDPGWTSRRVEGPKETRSDRGPKGSKGSVAPGRSPTCHAAARTAGGGGTGRQVPRAQG